MPQRHYLRGYLCAGGGAVIWGLTGTAGQYLLHHYTIDSFWISSVRLIGGGLILMLMAAPHYSAMKEMLKIRRNVILLLCYSIFGLLMSQTAFYTTIQYANAGTAAVLQTLCVVMMAVIVCFRGHRLPTRAETLSVILALAGVFLIATNGDPSTMVLSSKALMWGADHCRRQCLLFLPGAGSGLALGQYHCQRSGHVHRRTCVLLLSPAMDNSDGSGYDGIPSAGCRCPHRNGPDVQSFFARRRGYRSGQSDSAGNTGTSDLFHCISGLSGHRFLPSRAHRLCLHPGNGIPRHAPAQTTGIVKKNWLSDRKPVFLLSYYCIILPGKGIVPYAERNFRESRWHRLDKHKNQYRKHG